VAKQNINLGAAPNGAGGDDRRSAWVKAIAMFDELYSWFGELKGAAKADIVGPVSQVGGVPTGAIMQSGSNANGTWVRYANGEQVCYTNMNAASNITVPHGGIFRSNSAPWNFPMPFVGVPVVTPNVANNAGFTWAGIGSSGSTSSSTSVAAFAAGSIVNVPLLSVTARGRWF
jgi:hypothetical protein